MEKIKIPDGCIVDYITQDENSINIIFKKKKLTYTDIAKKLFKDGVGYYFNPDCKSEGIINFPEDYHCQDIALQQEQIKSLICLNMLANVAKYLNNGWEPDWENSEFKYLISYNVSKNELGVYSRVYYNVGSVYFKSKNLAEKAIEILGESIIKSALTLNY